jgi:hypothetical protein
MVYRTSRFWLRIAALVVCCLPALASAQIGHVVSVHGTALVERAGQPGRILGAGERLEQKDVINVAQGSSAVLEFRDKTRITLRPKTVFRVESYSDSAPVGMAFGLTKGGFRAVTGEVGKQNPSSVTFRADTVVLGIRGTEFDARLCEDDCAAEERGRTAQRVVAKAPARVIEMEGTVTAARSGAPGRSVVPGAVIYEGESIVTGPDSYAVIVFRDDSRITLVQNSELAITRFDFEESAPGKGQARLKLVSGNAHVWTGQLAKIGPDAFLFETAAGTIRPRGTGFSVGGEDVLIIHSWDGSVIIQTATERIELPKTGTLAIAIVDGKVTFLPAPPPQFTNLGTRRPDNITTDPSTFGQQETPIEKGLYVWVRNGAVSLGQGKQTVELTAGNAAHIGGERITMLNFVPNVLRFDQTPRPGVPAAGAVLRFFRASDGSITRMCK